MQTDDLLLNDLKPNGELYATRDMQISGTYLRLAKLRINLSKLPRTNAKEHREIGITTGVSFLEGDDFDNIVVFLRRPVFLCFDVCTESRKNLLRFLVSTGFHKPSFKCKVRVVDTTNISKINTYWVIPA